MSRYLPPLSILISADKLPDGLGFINTVFSKLYFRDFVVNKSFYSKEVHYSVIIISKTQIGLNIAGSGGLELLLNPDFTEGNISEFPISFSCYLPIIKYIRNFDLRKFDFSISAVYNLLLQVAGIDASQLLNSLVNNLYSPYGEEDEQDVYQLFIADFNNKHNPVTPIIYNDIHDEDLIAEDILLQMSSNGNDYNIFDVVFNDYLTQADDFGIVESKLKSLFYDSFGIFKIEDIVKNLFIPRIFASLNNITLSLSFPRTWLKPVDPDTNQPYEDENRKAMLRFDAGSVYFSTENGFEFENESSFSFDKSMIGNTGMTLEFTKVKLDLSRTTNIPEAAAAGYPEDFVGVFVKEAVIGLPEQWFKDTDGMSLVGRNLLIGTGGFSGTVGLKSTGTTWANLGDNGFRVGFNSFDLTFRQNAIVESNIRAKLVIPRFRDNATNEDLEIDVIGHLSENGEFNLTAALSPPLHANLFNFVNFDFKSFEIERQERDFYLDTSCDIYLWNVWILSLYNFQKIIYVELDYVKNNTILAA